MIMEQPTSSGPPNAPASHLSPIITAVIVTALVVGFGVYWFIKPAVAPSPIPMTSPIPTAQQSNFQKFITMAQAEPCANGRNEVYVIDNIYVLWLHQGTCSDAGYGYTLYGKDPSDILCQLSDSIAGPRESCTKPQYQTLFDVIKQHISDLVFNLPGHTMVSLYIQR